MTQSHTHKVIEGRESANKLHTKGAQTYAFLETFTLKCRKLGGIFNAYVIIPCKTKICYL